MKFVELVAAPPGVLTEMGAVFAPFGTVAEICVAEVTENEAVFPPNITLFTPVKFAPEMVTTVPTGPF